MLYAYKNKCAIPDIHKVPAVNSLIYENAQMYYNSPEWLEKDIREKWFPAFVQMLGADGEIELLDVKIRQQDPREAMKERMAHDHSLDKIDYATETHKKGSKVDHYTKFEVLARFGIKGFSESGYIPILHIPWVRPDGIIEYNGAEYSFIHIIYLFRFSFLCLPNKPAKRLQPNEGNLPLNSEYQLLPC